MNRSTKELYGYVPKDILETRNSLARYFIDSVNKKISELNKVVYMDRDEDFYCKYWEEDNERY